MSRPLRDFWTRGRREAGPEPGGEGRGPGRARPADRARRRAVALIVKRGLAQAEERYLVAPDATLGIWFARVAETVAVAARVVSERIEEGRGPEQEGVAAEQLGIFADICAESIRAASRICADGPSARVREEIVESISALPPSPAAAGWADILSALARCAAALEPLANGLRDGDLPMGEPTDCERVAEAMLEVAAHALRAIDALC